MKLIAAFILFLIGLILAVVTAVGYAKAKRTQGENFKVKPYIIQIAVVFAFFIIAQILLILNR